MLISESYTSSKSKGVLRKTSLFNAKRANARTSGAGYESGLILSEIRDDPKQTKYIPVVLDADADLGTCLPVFLKSRLCLKISNDEGFRKLIDAIKRR